MWYGYSIARGSTVASLVQNEHCNVQAMQQTRVEVQNLLKVFCGLLPSTPSSFSPSIGDPVSRSLLSSNFVKKRKHSKLSSHQKQRLTQALNQNEYLTTEQRQELITATGLTSNQITNFGTKFRRKKKQRLAIQTAPRT